MKQRFSSLDVKVIAHELSNSLITLRLANVYDLSSRIFLFKFAKPNHREQMVVDSGFRCHLSSYSRATAAEPSAFVSRLRKYLKTRRVTAISQIGTDRIIEIQFSDGQYRLFLEFYAGGNVILCDGQLTIMALLRTVSEAESQEELRVGVKYSLEGRQNYGGVPPLTRERVLSGLQRASDKAVEPHVESAKKPKKKSADSLRKALATTLTEFPPMLIDNVLRAENFDPTASVAAVIGDEKLLDSVMNILQKAKSSMDDIMKAPLAKGYILAKEIQKRTIIDAELPGGNESGKENLSLMYEDFQPFKPYQSESASDITILEFDGFNKTVDEYFSSIESQRLESRLTEREEQARKKLETARMDHQKRVGGLQQVQELNVRKAQAIEHNLQRVQEAISAVNGLVAQGMDWVEISRLIEMQQARKNPVAEMIKLPLKLYENTATVLLSDGAEPEDEDFEGDETDSDVSASDEEESKPSAKVASSTEHLIAVDVDLALSPFANARQYYEQQKTAKVKEGKTLQSSVTALKSTEKKINADLKKRLKEEKEVLRPVRRQLWFEKFYYFISSDGHLVLGGRDAQQNEILYRKYLSRGDVHISANIQGVSFIIIKNKPGMTESPIPPSTLSQAGTFCISTSSNWDMKGGLLPAWWVDSTQVTKIAPETGEYLVLGSFHIQGQKNYLPPSQLLLGLGVMFQVSDAGKRNHLKHRLQGDQQELELGDGNVPFDIQSSAPIDEDEHNQSDSDGQVNESANSEPVKQLGRIQAASDKDRVGEDSEEDEVNDVEAIYENPLQIYEDHRDQQSHSLNNDARPGEDVEELHHSEPSANTSQVSDNDSDTEEEIPESTETTDKPETGGTIATKSSNTAQVRGKHGKRQKMKTKYAHQDEEDRALALRLLGSSKAKEQEQTGVEAKATREAELLAQKERRREQHLRTQQSGKEAEETRRSLLATGTDILDEGEAAEMGMLENYFGTPLPGDDILDCLVMCGPWDSIQRFRWRVKIQPGTAKKGKIVKEILAGWEKSVTERWKRKIPSVEEEGYEEEKMLRREGDLVRGLKDVEVMGLVPVSKCRIMVSSGADSERGKKSMPTKGKRGGRGSKKTR